MPMGRRAAMAKMAGLALAPAVFAGQQGPDRVVAFDSPESDRLLEALAVFPSDDLWNVDVSRWPVAPNSEAIVASVGPGKPLRCNYDMNWSIVPRDQAKVPVQVVAYPDESDPGPFPLPDDLPIEGWPFPEAKGQRPDLADYQADRSIKGGDRHAIVVDYDRRLLHEFFVAKRVEGAWSADQASTFDLTGRKRRPIGWTSTDAAGLPIFPAIVKYHELKRGRIGHALRVTIKRSRKAFVAPATHYASRLVDKDLPRMGERFRLRPDYPLDRHSSTVATILRGLQTHGALVADNGIEWAISIAPDPRIPIVHEELRKVRGSDFQVVVAPTGGAGRRGPRE